MDAFMAIQKRHQEYLDKRKEGEIGLSPQQIVEKREAESKRISEAYHRKLKEIKKQYPAEQTE